MSDPDTALWKATSAGDSSTVLKLLQLGTEAHAQDEDGKSLLMTAAENGHAEVVRTLLEAGAPWNAFDKRGKCAGDYALEGGHQEAVDVLLQAEAEHRSNTAGVRAELILGAVERARSREEEHARSTSYLSERVDYGQGGDGADVLRDSEKKAVMMAWEGPLMEAHAHTICSRGGDILNIGFGLGLVDEAIQRRTKRDEHNTIDGASPPVKTHTIIEAHPDVFQKMKTAGWDRRPGVRLIFGRWQDTLKTLDQQYDGVFFDTYSEYYEDLRVFHQMLPTLLRRGGLYSYFNGLAADNPFFHLVYCEISKIELARLGFATQFVALPVNVSSKDVWEGVQNKYWQLDTYYLPVTEWEEPEGPTDRIQV